ncbi:MAG: D-aminoacylase [Gemmatimonadota bacterium]|nr:D-aminoacylase [Gemmatimonadota bacterium]
MRSPSNALIVAVVAIAGCAKPSASTSAPAAATFLIRDATVVDGTGAASRIASVRVTGDRIVDVGALTPNGDETVIDASRLVLAPGFVDTHSHADGSIFEHRDALAAVSQGITTVIVGQDGDSPLPLRDFFARLGREPAAVNIGSYVGHGTLRDKVLNGDYKRAATLAEIGRMSELLRQEMKAGALGLSTGLEYDPGIYSAPAEVLALAKVTAAAGGRYISHVRSEDREFGKAIDELLTIGREAKLPVQISHAKLAMRSLWGRTDSLLRVLDAARASGIDVTADVYPYAYWQSTLTVLFPNRDFDNRESAMFALREVAAPQDIVLTAYEPNPAYVGKTVADVAGLTNRDAASTLMKLILDAEALSKKTGRSGEHIIAVSMAEPDIEKLIAWPYSNICTDGELAGPHPRGFGSFPRVLGRYVRARHVLSLEEAVRKMSSLAARNVGLVNRGRIAPGYFADLVLLDPATVLDRATPAEPQAVSTGITRVWVNGTQVFADGRATGALPGTVLLRQ